MKYHNITYPDMNNGDGLRVVLWLSGCSHHCKGCQNPQTWNPDSGIEFDLSAKEEIFEQLSNDYINGITFSGGDPLHKNNIDEVLNLISEIRATFPNKTVWLYTGYKIEEIGFCKAMCNFLKGNCNFQEALDNESENLIRQMIITQCDALVDGRYDESKRNVNLPWVGSSNQRVIDVQKSLKEGEIVLWTN